VDVSDEPAPLRIAPELRLRTPFAWCAAPKSQRLLSPEVARADYSLRTLESAGLVRDVDGFTERTGLADFGWTMFANTGRLGPIDASSVLSRASDLVVLMHGTLCDRRVWTHAASAICRTNAQAVVLTPDVLGARESSFVSRDPKPEHATPRAQLEAVLAWLGLLNVRELPTVLVGHSLAGVALLSVSDGEVGERTSRIALTPMFPSYDSVFRTQLRTAAWLLRRLRHWPAAYAYLGKRVLVHGREMRGYAMHEREAVYQAFLSLAPGVIAQLAEQMSRAVPAPADRLERCLVVVGTNDPIAPIESSRAALQNLGFPARALRVMDTEGHVPIAELEDHPGWALRNGEHLARIVESLLVSSREGAPFSTALESTFLASTDPAHSEPA
jgi:pimeloyl-ACP methyl ester carboxylesterase